MIQPLTKIIRRSRKRFDHSQDLFVVHAKDSTIQELYSPLVQRLLKLYKKHPNNQ